jgi:hypothetical protein
MKKYILLIISIFCLAFVSMASTDDLDTINYSVSQSAGHFASDDTSNNNIPFSQEFALDEDQFFQCKVISVTDDQGLQLLVTNTDTGHEIINEKNKHLTYMNRLRLTKGNYHIQLISHTEQVSLDYYFSAQPYTSLSISQQRTFDF